MTRAEMDFDLAANVGRYECLCGAQVVVPIADLRAGRADYCGCGGMRVDLSARQVDAQRRLAGLPRRAGG